MLGVQTKSKHRLYILIHRWNKQIQCVQNYGPCFHNKLRDLEWRNCQWISFLNSKRIPGSGKTTLSPKLFSFLEENPGSGKTTLLAKLFLNSNRNTGIWKDNIASEFVFLIKRKTRDMERRHCQWFCFIDIPGINVDHSANIKLRILFKPSIVLSIPHSSFT